MNEWRPIRRNLTLSGVMVEAALLRSAGIDTFTPDLTWYQTYPALESTSLYGQRLFVRASDVDAARAILAERLNETEPVFPCPECGGETRRLRRILMILLLMLARNTLVPFPFFRRKRICMRCRTRFLPEPPAPFTAEELG